MKTEIIKEAFTRMWARMAHTPNENRSQAERWFLAGATWVATVNTKPQPKDEISPIRLRDMFMQAARAVDVNSLDKFEVCEAFVQALLDSFVLKEGAK